MSSSFQSRRGQAGLEYMALAVFVMAGIIIGGPYVVRSVNSHFKSVEEGAVDADREKIVQGPSDLTLPACTCGNLGGTACGDGSGGCSKRQRLLTRDCTPLGCQAGLPPGMQPEMTRCVDDPTNTCCEPVTNTGACGALATHIPPAGCPVGEMENKKLCGSPGSGTYIYGCAPSSSCATGCNPPGPNTTAAIWCDPAHFQDPPLLSSSIRPVANGHCLDDLDMRCKIECNAASYPVGAGCMPHCGNAICEDGTPGNPNYGETLANCPDDCGGSQWCVPVYIGPGPYSAWVAPAGDPYILNYQPAFFRATVNIVTPGTYTVYLDADDVSNAYIDGAFVESGNCCSGMHVASWDLTVGPHNIELQFQNAAGGPQNWGRNPGQIAFRLVDPSNTEIITTNATDIGRWVSTVACTNGVPWKCDIRTCDAPVCGDCVCGPGEDVTCPSDCLPGCSIGPY